VLEMALRAGASGNTVTGRVTHAGEVEREKLDLGVSIGHAGYGGFAMGW
jgi:hypothetical protein